MLNKTKSDDSKNIIYDYKRTIKIYVNLESLSIDNINKRYIPFASF